MDQELKDLLERCKAEERECPNGALPPLRVQGQRHGQAVHRQPGRSF